MIGNDDVVLFQGDSITDAGRSREHPGPNSGESLGRGYVFLAAAKLLAAVPGGTLQVFNRGVSGNRVTDLADRWKSDCIDLRPTIVSILIGVNDTWHGTAKGTPENGVPPDRYETIYRKLIADTRDALPNVRMVLCEPFVLRCGAVNAAWFPEFDQRRAIVATLAKEHGLPFVGFQSAFDEACRIAPPSYWAGDGVHPSLAGHELMAKAVCDVLLADG
jgi:lysophospholipase L1-like esterase